LRNHFGRLFRRPPRQTKSRSPRQQEKQITSDCASL
jgi:hypothetical protein